MAAATQTSVPEEIKAMGYEEKGAQAKLISYKAKPLAKHDADIVVTYNGVCGTDKHMIDNDWGMSRYPLVPGHEVVGHVLQVGAEVTNLKPGDVVGLGAQCQMCGDCEWCNKQRGNLCAKRAFTYMANTEDETGTHPHHGGFSSYLRTDSRLLFKIPQGVEERHAGPLMCGGLTVAAPLFEYAGPGESLSGKRVGIVGLGGLGHMAVMFASKMGAETWAVSRTADKKEFAAGLGATGYLAMSDEEAVKAAQGTFDYLLVCISGGKFDVMQYIGLLRGYGHMHFVGVPNEPLTFPVQPLMFQRLTISSSPIGSKEQMEQMLAFAAKHGIKPIIEEFKHSEANAAVGKVRDGSIRFRAVLKNDLI